jgi:hypothetical protein
MGRMAEQDRLRFSLRSMFLVILGVAAFFGLMRTYPRWGLVLYLSGMLVGSYFVRSFWLRALTILVAGVLAYAIFMTWQYAP